LIPNTTRDYKRLGDIINDARLLGLIDWDAIEDRGRNLHAISTWDTPSQIIATAAESYHIDYWREQPYYVETWVEKEALSGVVARPSNRWRVPYFACKGYVSQSEMWSAGHYRIRKAIRDGKMVVILHLGDHDPSGIDMTRDIQARLSMFSRADVEVRRLALNMDQVEQYAPPPNPAKLSDSRCEGYMARFGNESWELDALEPTVLDDLIGDAISGLVDVEEWEISQHREEKERAQLKKLSSRFGDALKGIE
jgi:hypothetical protein